MPNRKRNLLLVEDDADIRLLLSVILDQSDFAVRTAGDGFAALAELRTETPDVLLSDLYMPGMSGFELLSVVRRRFPAIPVVAMSSAFSGTAVPTGIAADAFYEKASGIASLLQIVEYAAHLSHSATPRNPNTLAPIWVIANGHDAAGRAQVILACPECLRTFPQALADAHTSAPQTSQPVTRIHQTCCAFCTTAIHYAMVESAPAQSHVRSSSLPPSRLMPPPRATRSA